jgi:hypothetical protein
MSSKLGLPIASKIASSYYGFSWSINLSEASVSKQENLV